MKARLISASAIIAAAKPVMASEITRSIPYRCAIGPANCEALKKPIALAAKASEKPIGDSPYCRV